MNTEAVRMQELQAQMDEWQAEIDLLEAWPETRIEHKERIEALREKLRAAAEMLSAWRNGGRPEIP
jgi:Tfp pilus assembly protein PilN